MRSITSIADDMMSITDLIAASIIRQTTPVKDEISEAEAQRQFGTRWMRARKKDGSAKYHCTAGKNIYSRQQLMCLKQAEKEVSDEIMMKSI